jgi:hypothetical protein
MLMKKRLISQAGGNRGEKEVLPQILRSKQKWSKFAV